MIEGSSNEDMLLCARPFFLFLSVVDEEDEELFADGGLARTTVTSSSVEVVRAKKNNGNYS